MKYRLLGLLCLASASLALADVPETLPARSDFLRDQTLIEKFVAAALDLARENDPLKRARQCNVLAGFLTKEIQEASRQRQGPRAAAFGKMLQTMLTDGIATNLKQAGADTQPEGPRAQEILQISESMAANVTRPLEKVVEQLPPQDQPAMKTVLDAVNKVQKSSQGHSKKSNKNKKIKK